MDDSDFEQRLANTERACKRLMLRCRILSVACVLMIGPWFFGAGRVEMGLLERVQKLEDFLNFDKDGVANVAGLKSTRAIECESHVKANEDVIIDGKSVSKSLSSLANEIEQHGLYTPNIKIEKKETRMLIDQKAGDGKGRYLEYEAPNGWHIVGAGAWIEGGWPLPVIFNQTKEKESKSVSTFIQDKYSDVPKGDKKITLSVVIVKGGVSSSLNQPIQGNSE